LEATGLCAAAAIRAPSNAPTSTIVSSEPNTDQIATDRACRRRRPPSYSSSVLDQRTIAIVVVTTPRMGANMPTKKPMTLSALRPKREGGRSMIPSDGIERAPLARLAIRRF